MFDAQAFRKAKYETRQGSVPVPELADFFPEDEEPVFTVRGLDSNELHKADNSVTAGSAVLKVLEKLAGGNDTEKAAAAVEALGIIGPTEVEPSLKRMILQVHAGLVAPELSEADVVLLSEKFPVQFKSLHLKIIELTGLGAAATVKRRPSGGKAT